MALILPDQYSGRPRTHTNDSDELPSFLTTNTIPRRQRGTQKGISDIIAKVEVVVTKSPTIPNGPKSTPVKEDTRLEPKASIKSFDSILRFLNTAETKLVPAVVSTKPLFRKDKESLSSIALMSDTDSSESKIQQSNEKGFNPALNAREAAIATEESRLSGLSIDLSQRLIDLSKARAQLEQDIQNFKYSIIKDNEMQEKGEYDSKQKRDIETFVLMQEKEQFELMRSVHNTDHQLRVEENNKSLLKNVCDRSKLEYLKSRLQSQQDTFNETSGVSRSLFDSEYEIFSEQRKLLQSALKECHNTEAQLKSKSQQLKIREEMVISSQKFNAQTKYEAESLYSQISQMRSQCGIL